MTGAHFQLELKLLLNTRLFAATAGLFIALAVLAGWQGGQLARAQAAAIEAARDLERKHDAEALAKATEIRSGEIDPPWWQSPLNVQAWSYAMIRHVSLPPRPLAGAAVADTDLKPFLFRINPHPPDRWSNRASELTPSVAAYGGFDLADLILILTPLLVIIAFAGVIADRNGSERQRLAIIQKASETGLLSARLAPRAIIVLVIIALAALAGLIATVPPLAPETITGGLAIIAAFLGHGLFWIAAAAALILLVRKAVTTFSTLVALWFVLAVLAPLIVEVSARISAPPPSPLAGFAAERAAIVAARMQEEDLTRTYAQTDPLAREMLLTALARDQLLITPTNLLIQREVDRQLAAARASRQAARTRFEARLEALAGFSPMLAARRVVYAAAGRGPDRRTAFDAQVAAYYLGLQESFVPLLMRRATLDDVLLPAPFEFQEP